MVDAEFRPVAKGPEQAFAQSVAVLIDASVSVELWPTIRHTLQDFGAVLPPIICGPGSGAWHGVATGGHIEGLHVAETLSAASRRLAARKGMLAACAVVTADPACAGAVDLVRRSGVMTLVLIPSARTHRVEALERAADWFGYFEIESPREPESEGEPVLNTAPTVDTRLAALDDAVRWASGGQEWVDSRRAVECLWWRSPSQARSFSGPEALLDTAMQYQGFVVDGSRIKRQRLDIVV